MNSSCLNLNLLRSFFVLRSLDTVMTTSEYIKLTGWWKLILLRVPILDDNIFYTFKKFELKFFFYHSHVSHLDQL